MEELIIFTPYLGRNVGNNASFIFEGYAYVDYNNATIIEFLPLTSIL